MNSRPAIPRDTLHHGDNLPFMADLPDGCCDLIYLDPPFFSGKVRSTRGSARKPPAASADNRPQFGDIWAGGIKSYLAFMYPRLVECHRLLGPRGTLFVHADWHASHHLRIQLDTIFGAENFLNEIIWHYRTGGVSRRWFARKHDSILAYARRLGRHTFTAQRSGEFRTDGLKLDEHGRPYKSTKRGRLYFHADGPVLSDVWDLPFLSTVSLERTGWPTQKPLALLDRIIRAGSRPGDLVADFFCGSGTTLVAAKKLGRHWLGCDASMQALRIARGRLQAARSPSRSPIRSRTIPLRRL